MDEKLDYIFKNVNDWLKFAEQKNASLIILNTGIIWGVSRIFTNLGVFESSSNLNLLAYLLIVLSSFFCIISFFPVLSISWFNRDKKQGSDNCLYFMHIAKYSSSDFLQLLKVRINTPNAEHTGYQLDLASQIVINSKIALDKFTLFKASSIMTVCGIFVFILMIIIHFMGK